MCLNVTGEMVSAMTQYAGFDPLERIADGALSPRAGAVLHDSGLAVSHLLGGIARMVQHPKAHHPYWVHLVWTVFLFLYLIHFWWWEFGLHRVVEWTFPLYLFIALYAVLMYLLCTLMYPVTMTDYQGFVDYFYSRQGWIFGLFSSKLTAHGPRLLLTAKCEMLASKCNHKDITCQ